MNNILPRIALLTAVFTLTACGVTKMRTVEDIKDVSAYKTVYVADVVINAGENNPDQQKINDDLVASTTDQLKKATTDTQKFTVAGSKADAADGLVVETEIRLNYGNRALRHFVGFGAGKAKMESLLTVKDAKTGEVKLNIIAESELAGGSYGGDVKSVIKDNIKNLVKTYQKKMSQ